MGLDRRIKFSILGQITEPCAWAICSAIREACPRFSCGRAGPSLFSYPSFDIGMRSVDMRVCSPFSHSAIIKKKNRGLGVPEAAVIHFLLKIHPSLPRGATQAQVQSSGSGFGDVRESQRLRVLLVPQGLDWVHQCRPTRGINAKEDSNRNRNAKCEHDRSTSDDGFLIGNEIDDESGDRGTRPGHPASHPRLRARPSRSRTVA